MKLSEQITRRQVLVAFGSSQQTGSLSSVDLAASRDGASVTLTASDGSVAPISGADASGAGVMTTADKLKLDGLPPTATREFKAFTDIRDANVGSGIAHLRTGGYLTGGDGGGALYRRVATEPSHAFKAQSLDGAWWEGVVGALGVDIRQVGAKVDGVTDDVAAVQSAIDVGADIFFPRGTCNISSSITTGADGQKFHGIGAASVIHMTSIDTDILNVTHDRVTVEGVFFKGNNTVGGGGGHEAAGIDADGVTDLSVRGCFFDEVGEQDASAGSRSPIELDACARVKVHGNSFLNACTNSRGADVTVADTSFDISLIGNVSNSNCDAFTNFNGRRGVIADNIIIRSDDRRHGILAGYGGKLIECSITGNIIYGTAWTGIYLSNAEVGTGASASVSITGNHIYRCGGADPANAALQAAIYLAGNDGVTCQGNFITEAGITTNGTARATACPAISVSEVMRGGSLTGNHIYKPTGNGIAVTGADADTIKNLVIEGNVIREAGVKGIDIRSNSSTAVFESVFVRGNMIDMGAVDAGGVCIAGFNGGMVQNVDIEHNVIVCAAAAPTAYGLELGSASWTNRVRWNRVKGFDRAIRVNGAGNRDIGNNLKIDFNRLEDCAIGISAFISGDDRAFVEGNEWVNVTSQMHGNARILEARRLGHDASGNMLYEQWADSAPTAGSYLAGDRVRVRVPAANGYGAYGCVMAGTPGSWKGIGLVEA